MEREKILLSVIIPSYNFKSYIVDCIKSVLMQRTNFEYEIIVSDDFSNDGTNDLLKEEFHSEKRLSIIENNENVGAYKNIRNLLKKSKGKYIAYLDGDDLFEDVNKLRYQVDFLENNPEYSMHSTGYKYIDEKGSLLPPCDEGGRWLYPTIPDLSTVDLLEKNQVGFGRVFRNYENLLTDEYMGISYVDWIINFECSLRGKIKCVQNPTGFYRISDSGMYSKVSEEKKEKERSRISGILKSKYLKMNSPKTISIIDCFIHDEKIENNLINLVNKLKSIGQDVLLVSNTAPNKRVLDKVDYFLYDSRNQLFKKEYPGIADVDFWINNGGFTVHNVKSGLQKHGLSVLINIFNSIGFAKDVGYTHFQRFETDDLYGPLSMEYIKGIPDSVITQGKKGIFYLNPGNTPPDASFHYFFCEIDYFQKIMRRISSEENYEEYLMDVQGSRNFKIVEAYLFDHIMKDRNREHLVIKNGGLEMKSDFSDTIWNTVVSASNLPGKYKGCLTDLYRIMDQNGNHLRYCVYSTNYLDQTIHRPIKVILKSGNTIDIEHRLNGKGSWCLNDLGEDPIQIDVYQDGEILYSHTDENYNSYIQIN